MTARQIQMEVCATHGVSLEKLIGGGNQAEYVAARNEAMFRIRAELKMTYPQIGRIFGKHHTSVIHGVKTHASKAGLPGATRPEHLEAALVRQARLIAAQASTIADMSRQLEALSNELLGFRIAAAGCDQMRLFEIRKSA